MHSEAYFISPRGQLISVTSATHIADIIKYPEKFNLTLDDIKQTYNKYGETLGWEGKAREEILLSLLKQGWTRIRKYKNFWSIQIKKMSKQIKEQLHSFAEIGLAGEPPFKGRVWGNEIVKITSLFDNKVWNYTFNDIAGDILYNEAVSIGVPPVDRLILEVISLKDYQPEKLTLKEYIRLFE